MVKKIVLILVSVVFLCNCYKNSPTVHDGNFKMEVYVKYDSAPLSNMVVSLSTNDYLFETRVDTTDSLGFVSFDDLLYAQYLVSASGNSPVVSEENPNLIDNAPFDGDSLFFPDRKEARTLEATKIKVQPGIKINEIYSAGPINNINYFYDQYIELYNSSDETLYLDGMVICRMSEWLANITYIFQFPGEPMGGTTDYPIEPGEYKVIAHDAINHRDLVFQGKSSIDLSNADFEFKNSTDYGDPDNPDVPNLDNIEDGHHLDFFLSVTSDVVLIADGSDLNYLDGMDAQSVVDCVEYSAKADHEKDIEDIVDRGFAGVGQSRYSGTSIERIAPGYDTNNSTIDFVIINHPTIGYHHEEDK